MKTNYEIIIVGAGISGCTLAERYANEKNKKVLIIDNREHVGGNCYEYIQKFSTWRKFEAKVLSNVDGKKVPIPVNIDTVNSLFDLNLKNDMEMSEWLSKEIEHIQEPKNSEEAALVGVGRRIYEKMFKNYTQKQWGKSPKELDPSIMNRIPIRLNHEQRYNTDKYQLYPENGYTEVFNKMLQSPNIEIKLNTDWDEIKDSVGEYEKIFFTGKIDSYFLEKLGKLEYRSLRFEEENIDKEFFQSTVQENYPDIKVPFTRITEYKYQTGQKNPKTTIVREYPMAEGEPYYPVPTKKNQDLFKKYQEQADAVKDQNVHFVGRLANYKYFNMDQAIKNALDLFNELENNNK